MGEVPGDVSPEQPVDRGIIDEGLVADLEVYLRAPITADGIREILSDALSYRELGGRPTPESAAEALATMLEQTQQDRLHDCSLEMQVPKWAVMLAAVARMATDNQLFNGDYSMDWMTRATTVGATGLFSVCEHCQGKIMKPYRGQRYCCNGHGSLKPFHTPDCKLDGVLKTTAPEFYQRQAAEAVLGR